jgi:hypothetical protein
MRMVMLSNMEVTGVKAGPKEEYDTSMQCGVLLKAHVTEGAAQKKTMLLVLYRSFCSVTR